MGKEQSFAERHAAISQTLEFAVEMAQLEFLEKICARQEELGVDNAALAERLGVKRGWVTRLMRGNLNLTLLQMVRIVRALDSTLSVGLQVDRTRNRMAGE